MIVNIKKPITVEKIEKAFAKLSKKREEKKGFDSLKHAGKLKGVFGDALKYQKAMRNEWE